MQTGEPKTELRADTRLKVLLVEQNQLVNQTLKTLDGGDRSFASMDSLRIAQQAADVSTPDNAPDAWIIGWNTHWAPEDTARAQKLLQTIGTTQQRQIDAQKDPTHVFVVAAEETPALQQLRDSHTVEFATVPKTNALIELDNALTQMAASR